MKKHIKKVKPDASKGPETKGTGNQCHPIERN